MRWPVLLHPFRSQPRSYQVNDREDSDPDDVERMPEQVEAEQAPQDRWAKILDPELRHHRAEPEQADRHMQAMAADQREETGKKRAALRPGAMLDHPGKLADLQRDKGEAEKAGHQQP